jgi:hypothetical protein
MTDLSTPAPLFAVQLLAEPVETAMFGPVTVHEISGRRITALYEQYSPGEDPRAFGYALMCETVRGPNGERFTMELFDDLPNRAMPDVALLLRTAVRINGVSSEEVEKASPLQ